jgi:hypothetical protein
VNTKRFIFLLGIATALAIAGGCKRDEGIRVYNAPKDPPPGKPAVASASVHQHDGASGPVTWTAPAGWTEVDKAPMSYATLQPAAEPSIRVTISQAGGGLLPNINRWEGQLGLPPSSGPEDLKKVATPITKADGEQALLIDLTGAQPASADKPQQRMVAAIIAGAEGRMWFFKMTGAADKVGGLKPQFEELVKSATFANADAKSPAPAAQPQAADDKPAAPGEAARIPGIASFTLPEGWQVDPKPRAMRAGTLLITSGNEVAEMAISQLPAAALADMQGNINRWRRQVDLPPTTDANAHPAQEVTFPQGPGVVLTFDGPESAGAARKRLYVVMTKFPRSEQIWFFRLLGPFDLVGKSKPGLDAFVKSVKFDEK